MRCTWFAGLTLAGVLLGRALVAQPTPKLHTEQTSLGDSVRWQKVIEKHLVAGRRLVDANEGEFLAGLSAAIKEKEQDGPELVHAAVIARPKLALQVVRTSFEVVNGCEARAKILFVVRVAEPENASQLLDEAIKLAPDCANHFEGAVRHGDGKSLLKREDSKSMLDIGEGKSTGDSKSMTGDGGGPGTNTGSWGNPPGTNTGSWGNPPGLNGQGNLVAVCHNGQTILLTPEDAARDLRQNPGDTIGACQVTPSTNR